MKAHILTLFSDSSTEEICKQISQIIQNFKGRHYIERIDTHCYDYCAVFTSKKVSPKEAKILYEALDSVRQFEREREYLEEEKASRLEIIYEEIKRCIEFDQIYKLPKKITLLKELMFEPLYI